MLPIDDPIERDHELERIDVLIAAALDRRGQIAVIEGPSGMGKSMLIAAARERAHAAGMQVLEATGSELEVNYPFGTMLRLLDGWRARNSDAAFSEVLRGQAALIKPLLGESDDAVGHATEFSIIHGLYWCAVNISEHTPTVILVDDAHWADDESLRCLNYVTSRLTDLPVVVLLAVRTGDARSDSQLVHHLAAAADFRPIRPQALTPAAVETMLRRHTADLELTPEVVRRCWEATAGNPFLLHELAVAIEADGASWLHSHPEQLASFAPDTVRRQVLLRLSRLGQDAVKLSRAVAVLGGAAHLDLAAELAGLDIATAVAENDRLVAAHVLLDDPRPTFRHPMIRASVYEDLPPGHLAVAHAECATLLHSAGHPAQVIAPHLLLGLPIAEDWAVETLSAAARAAYRKGSPAAAVRYLRHAVRLCESGSRHAETQAELGLMEVAAGDIRAGAERLRETAPQMTDPVARARCLYTLGVTLARVGRFEEGCEALEQCSAAVREHDPELSLQADVMWIFLSYYLHRAEPRAMALLDRRVAELDTRPVRTTSERLLVALDAVRRSLQPGQGGAAVRLAREALETAGSARGSAASVVVNLAVMALTFTEHFDEAAEAAELLHTAARTRGSLPAVAETAFMRGLVEFTRGDLTDAWVSTETALEIAGGRHGLGPMATGILAQCLVARDRLDEAAAVLGDVDLGALPAENPGPGAWIQMARGRLREARGDHRAALEAYLAVGRSLQVCEATSPAVLRWRSLAALAAHACGDLDQARRLAAEDLEHARALGLRRAAAGALCTAAAIETDAGVRIQLAEEALGVLEPLGTSLDLALALIEHGRALHADGRPVEARGPLSRALDLAYRIGALGAARHAREELLATGAKPRRPHAGGVHSLTPTELRVAKMAADGLTNREIGETLFLAKTTVAWHLRNVFRKLTIESRSELSAVLAGTRGSTGAGGVRRA